jgi:hypothetical protein
MARDQRRAHLVLEFIDAAAQHIDGEAQMLRR